MEMQIKRESRETEQQIVLKPMQTVIETEVTLPGGLRDETSVYYADATVTVNDGEITGSRVMAEGRAIFHILFSQGDMTKIRPLEASADFTQALTVPYDTSDASSIQIKLCAQVLNVSAKVFNGRLALRAVVNIQGELSVKRNVGLITELSPSEHVQRKTEVLGIQRTTGNGEAQSTIRDEIELSDLLQVKETLLASGYAVVEDIKLVSDGKARVSGTIHLDACHTSDMPQRPLISTVHTVPYEQEIALSGTVGDVLSAQTAVLDVAVVSRDRGEQGEKEMRCEIVVNTSVQAMKTEQLQLLQDAYTTDGDNISAQFERMCLCTETVQDETAESGKIGISLSEDSPRIRQPLLGFARPILLQAQRNGSKLHVSGIMEVTAIYLPDESTIPVSVSVQTPFSAAFTTGAIPEDQLNLHVTEPVLSTVTSDRLEMKYILHMRSTGIRTWNTRAMTDVAMIPDGKRQKGISLCYTQPGETLWDIAKRYRISVDEIVLQNPERGEKVSAGDALLVFRSTESPEQKDGAQEKATV